jgi:hypothetical protein
MKAIFTIALAIIAFAANAQSSVNTEATFTLANDHVATEGSVVFEQKSAYSGKSLFSATSAGAVKRLFITNTETNEIIISNVLEISNEFSIEYISSSSLDLATVALERIILEIED